MGREQRRQPVRRALCAFIISALLSAPQGAALAVVKVQTPMAVPGISLNGLPVNARLPATAFSNNSLATFNAGVLALPAPAIAPSVRPAAPVAASREAVAAPVLGPVVLPMTAAPQAQAVQDEGLLPRLTCLDRVLSEGEPQSQSRDLRAAFDNARAHDGPDGVLASPSLGADVSRPDGARGIGSSAGTGRTDFLAAGALGSAIEHLKELKAVLNVGRRDGDKPVGPFVFRKTSGELSHARAAGLEGFLYSKLEIQSEGGDDLDQGQSGQYFQYLDELLSPYAWTSPLRQDLDQLRRYQGEPREMSRRLDERLIAAVKEYQSELRAADASGWFRGAGVYMILARAYNRLRPGRNFFDSLDDAELRRIQDEVHADTVWLLDVFEIGEVRRWGTGGGSPYAIKGYKFKPELGGEDAFKRFVARAHALGLKVGLDEIPNHVSLDSDLVKTYPEALIHIVPPQNLSREEILAQAPPYFYYIETDRYPEDGRRVHKKILVHNPRTGYGDGVWADMAQRDYTRQVARDWEVQEARRMVADLGVDVLRRDMAYYITNAYYFSTWLGYLRQERDQARGWARKALDQTIAEFQARMEAVKDKEVLEDATYLPKQAKPGAAMFDEAYGYETDLSQSGSNGVYNKNDHDAALGQIGLYDALVSRDAGRIRAALKNAAFRAWQRGGGTTVNFIGTHDGGEGNPVDKFGRFFKASALMALLLRPVLIYNGVEQGVGQRDNLLGDLGSSTDREKAIPFDIPVAIDWAKSDFARQDFIRLLLAKSAQHRDLFDRGAMDVLEPVQATPLAAYSVSAVSGGNRRTVLAAANFGDGRAGEVFRFQTPLTSFGAFVPAADKTYVLRDVANRGPDGRPALYVRSGKELLEKGLYLELDGGGVHLFEIDELPKSILSSVRRWLLDHGLVRPELIP